MTLGVIIVDHGSRKPDSNRIVATVASLFAQKYPDVFPIVEPAHMELAEPSIATAYARCVQRDAREIIMMPFFLGPGKHWSEDIPRLTAEIAARFPNTRAAVAEPLGADDLLLQLVAKRLHQCLTQIETAPAPPAPDSSPAATIVRPTSRRPWPARPSPLSRSTPPPSAGTQRSTTC
jgi:sirohydrochlorin ferrochelatase